MISKETLHRFLVELDNRYGNSGQYFMKHPYNEMQHKLFELNALCEKHKMQVNWNHRNHNGTTAYDVSDMFDIRNRLIDARSPDDYHVTVFSSEDSNPTALTPDSDVFKQIVKLFVETEGMVWQMPTDVITIDDMSFTVHDVLVAINKHAEIHRLKKHMIVDRYVVNSYKTEGLDITSSPRFSDELCDEIEQLAEEILPYWVGGKLQEAIEHQDSFCTWEDIFEGKDVELSKENIVYMCQNPPPKDTRDNIPALINLVDYLLLKQNRFMSAMFIRAITQAQIAITYKTVPKFQGFVQDMSLYVREIRTL